ncbi:hypothetical protein NLX83_01160 [Allokutzneria sp. A3M-2-11 16]|uniref:hypothetical protein n=1 Tax=Allokutzneria sp. A3M-2-11 16 TaxID=2962043 RepID=UPI0020B73988|nr:hypothetical protein [Allokutzneria sp. A3M-2-11 16]MCP3797859.1 hypothetical protein [Allokutzneria sp. A3M-2-11 16]
MTRPNARRNALITALLLVIVVAGGTATALLLSRGGGQTAPSTTAPPPPEKTTPPPVTTRPLPPARNAGWQVIANHDSGLIYEVPGSWALGGARMARPGGVLSLSGLAAARPFQCDGKEFVRGEVGSGRMLRRDDPAIVAGAVAEGAAKSNYGSPTVELGPPAPVAVDNLAGATVVADVSSTAPSPCHASKARITVLALTVPNGTVAVKIEVPEDGKDAQFSPSADEVRRILESVRLLS